LSDADDFPIPVTSLDAYRIERSAKYCQHGQRLIDTADRSLKCQSCGASLDPFDALVSIARDRDALVFQRTDLRQRIARLQAKLADLRKNEENTRARLQRLSKKKLPLETAE
jgi:hypothetical protein